LVSDIPAGDGKNDNLFYSVERGYEMELVGKKADFAFMAEIQNGDTGAAV
jgi:hypothetical protein